MNGITKKLSVVLATLLAMACASEPVAGPEVAPPTANAGPDLRVIDRDGNGWEDVVLRAWVSATDLHEVYRWMEDGEVLTWLGLGGEPYGVPWTLSTRLDVGRHDIVLEVMNAAGSDSDSIVVEVLPPNPSLQIATPRGDQVFATGTEVWFLGRGTDQYGEPLAGKQLSWASDLDGPIGTGEVLRLGTLSQGTHLITLKGIDGGGFVGTASVAITIADPPTVTILSPADGSSCNVFDEMRLEGECVDQEGKPVTGRGVYWEPDMWMGTERRYEMTVWVVCAGPGVEKISLVCTDENGLTSRAGVTVNYVPSFSFHIQAVLADFGCTGCHGPFAQEGNIRLDTYEALVSGANGNGPLIVPGYAIGGTLIPKLLSGHHAPDWQSLTTPFYWGWVHPDIGVVRWWVERFLVPWIDGGAPDN